MKLADARDAYYCHSGSASAVGRQVAFAGIAIIWIFKNDISGNIVLPQALLLSSFSLLIALSLDLLQYVSASAIWGIYHRAMEKKHNVEYKGEVYPSKYINWPANFIFWMKFVFIIFGYALLIKYAINNIQFK